MTDKQKIIFRRGLACLCAAGFLVVLILVVTGRTAGFDDPVRQFFYGLRGDGLTSVLVALTNLANKYVIIALCLILLILPWTRLPFGLPLSAGALATILLNTGLKHLIERDRPALHLHLVEEDGFSFASGHSVMSVFFYGMGLWLIWHYAGRGYPAGSRKNDAAGSATTGVFAADGRASKEVTSGAEDVDDAGSAASSETAHQGPSLLRTLPIYYEKRTAMVLTVLLLIPLVTVGLTRIYLGVHFPTDVLGGWCLGGFLIFLEAEILLALERRR